MTSAPRSQRNMERRLSAMLASPGHGIPVSAAVAPAGSDATASGTSLGGWGTYNASSQLSVAEHDQLVGDLAAVTSHAAQTKVLTSASETWLGKALPKLSKVLNDGEVAARFLSKGGLTHLLTCVKVVKGSNLVTSISALRSLAAHESGMESLVSQSSTSSPLLSSVVGSTARAIRGTSAGSAGLNAQLSALKECLSLLNDIVIRSNDGVEFVLNMKDDTASALASALATLKGGAGSISEVQLAFVRLMNVLLTYPKDEAQHGRCVALLNATDSSAPAGSISSLSALLSSWAAPATSSTLSATLREEVATNASLRSSGYRSGEVANLQRREIQRLKSQLSSISALAMEYRSTCSKLEDELKNFKRREPLVQLLWTEIAQLREALQVAVAAGFAYDLSDPTSRYVKPGHFAYIDRLDVQTWAPSMLAGAAGAAASNNNDEDDFDDDDDEPPPPPPPSSGSPTTRPAHASVLFHTAPPPPPDDETDVTTIDEEPMSPLSPSPAPEPERSPSPPPAPSAETTSVTTSEAPAAATAAAAATTPAPTPAPAPVVATPPTPAPAPTAETAPTPAPTPVSASTATVATEAPAAPVVTPAAAAPADAKSDAPAAPPPAAPAPAPTLPDASPAPATPDTGSAAPQAPPMAPDAPPLAPPMAPGAPDAPPMAPPMAPGAPAAPPMAPGVPGAPPMAPGVPGAPSMAPGAPGAPPMAPPPSFGAARPTVQPTKAAIKPPRRMKPLHWTRLLVPAAASVEPDSSPKEDESIWARVTRKLPEVEKLIPQEELDALFAAAPTKDKAANNDDKGAASRATSDGASASSSSPSGAVSPRRENVRLLPDKRFNAVAIMLSFLPPISEVLRGIKNLDLHILDKDQVAALHKQMPTEEEMKLITSCDCAVEELAKPEQFLAQLASIPAISSRIDCWHFSLSFAEAAEDLRAPFSILAEAMQAVRESKCLPLLCAVVLSAGNYLNGGTGRGQADGFDLSVLSRLHMVRMEGGNMLTYVANKLIEMEDIDFGDRFVAELSCLRAASEFPLRPALAASTRFQALIKTQRQLVALVQAAGVEEGDPFVEKMTEFGKESERVGAELKELGQLCNDRYQQLLLYLNPCMDAATVSKTNSEELFANLLDIANAVKDAADARKRAIENEAKQAKIEAMRQRQATAKAKLAAEKEAANQAK